MDGEDEDATVVVYKGVPVNFIKWMEDDSIGVLYHIADEDGEKFGDMQVCINTCTCR